MEEVIKTKVSKEIVRGETRDMAARIKDAAWESDEEFTKIIVDYREKSKEDNKETVWLEIYRDLKAGKEHSKYSNVDFAVINDVIAKNLGVGISTVERFSKGRPSKRSDFIKLCVLCKVTLKDTNLLLKRIGFKELYGRDIDDCIFMYMLAADTCTKSVYKRFDEIKKDITGRMGKTADNAVSSVPTATVSLEEQLLESFSSYESFCSFVSSAKNAFATANERVLKEIRSRVDERGLDAVDFRNSTFRNKYNKVVEKTSAVNREFLIQLGIHLCYDSIDINELLESCGYLNLFSKDMLESCIFYVLEVISLVLNDCYDNEENSLKYQMKAKIIKDGIERNGYACVVAEMLEEIFEKDEVNQLFGKEIDNVRTKNFLGKLRNK